MKKDEIILSNEFLFLSSLNLGIGLTSKNKLELNHRIMQSLN
jgi:hypothetical protein